MGGRGEDSETDLFGFEGPPTLIDKRQQLTRELEIASTQLQTLEKYMPYKDFLTEMTEDKQQSIAENTLDIIRILSYR